MILPLLPAHQYRQRSGVVLLWTFTCKTEQDGATTGRQTGMESQLAEIFVKCDEDPLLDLGANEYRLVGSGPHIRRNPGDVLASIA